jgi:Rieske Fe-S protein
MNYVTSRRHLLGLCGAGLAGSVLACGGGDGSAEPFGDVSAGLTTDLPVGTIKAVGSSPVLIARDAGGLYALTSSCTHQGGTVRVGGTTTKVLTCPNHGSRFDANGAVTMGPATRPLTHFAVSVDAMTKQVTVHGGTPVDAAVRVPIA